MAVIDDELLEEIRDEAQAAHDRYGQFASTHEAMGVLVEEMDELKRAIQKNAMASVAMEAKQVSAVAGRLFAHAEAALQGCAVDFWKRSGCE
jgi:NTP pyrophosphatase (non-canonical NTP hydrolase)